MTSEISNLSAQTNNATGEINKQVEERIETVEMIMHKVMAGANGTLDNCNTNLQSI